MPTNFNNQNKEHISGNVYVDYIFGTGAQTWFRNIKTFLNHDPLKTVPHQQNHQNWRINWFMEGINKIPMEDCII